MPQFHDRCPVRDEAVARAIAETVIAARAQPHHVGQAGYRLNVEDAGRHWRVTDGPNMVETADSIIFQAGGNAISFKIAKCTGAVSDFTITSWR